MGKKIFIGVVVLGIIVAALLGISTYMFADEVVKAHEPQLRQYIQLDTAAQNEYIIKNADELLLQAATEATEPQDKAEMELLNKAKDDPEFRKALVDLGRSFLARAIMHSDAIVKEMSEAQKTQYQNEADKLSASIKEYDAARKAVLSRLN